MPEQQCQLKAADFFRANTGTSIEVEKYECSHCGRPMWGDNPKKNDLCEDCAIQFMHEAVDAVGKRNDDRFVNPFDSLPDGAEHNWDFAGDVLRLF